MKTLVIGYRAGNIMAEWMAIHSQGPRCVRDVRAPSKDDFNVDAGWDKEIAYLSAHGPFDEIIYAAGYNQLEWIKDVIRTQHIHHTFQVNVIGFVELISAHIHLHDRAPRRIVAVSSDAGRVAMRGSLAYGSSKAALNAAIKNMARELAPESVVVGVAPGMVDDTPMTRYIDANVWVHRDWTPEYARQYEEAGRPMVRRITRKEVVETIHFALTGPEMLSGSIIEITGGK